MGRFLLGGMAALSLAAAGLFWWQGSADKDVSSPLLAATLPTAAGDLPTADGAGMRGAAPPEADAATREEKRFGRLDRDSDGRITRNEMLTPRVAAFRKLDKDGNNLLSFEEWAARTSDKFAHADINRDGALDAAEFATTKPVRKAPPRCACAPARSAAGSEGDEAEPGG